MSQYNDIAWHSAFDTSQWQERIKSLKKCLLIDIDYESIDLCNV